MQMQRMRISPAERKTMAIGGALIVALFAGARGVPAWRSWEQDTLAAAAERIAEAERAERSVRSLDSTLDSLERRRDRLVALSSALVGSGTAPSTAGMLAARVSGAAAAANVTLGAIQMQVDTAAAGVFTRVSIRAGATGDVRGVARLLADLERGPPLLSVREWSVTQPDPAAGAHEPEALRVEFLVQGLALTRRAGGAP